MANGTSGVSLKKWDDLVPDCLEIGGIGEAMIGFEFDEGGVGIDFEKVMGGSDRDRFVVFSVDDEDGNFGGDDGIIGVLLGVGDELVTDLGVLLLAVVIDGVESGVAPGGDGFCGLVLEPAGWESKCGGEEDELADLVGMLVGVESGDVSAQR